ncbi:hypothetical protein [Sneathiella sp.]|uniref:hypothetical protein n=1 Tax=Sneathiella sp. TaxID=1964365 RepID=UPI0026284A13|nr:hypothetical protein [Sneathiella sp.]MDF2367990.1 hypothetical protein [Sneathiella sp.]
MLEIHLERDKETGLIESRLSPENNLLKEFFETEIQDDMALINYLRTKTIDQEGEDYEITGNSFTLTLTLDRYIITPIYEDTRPPQDGPREDFFYLLDRWRQFLKREAREN